MTITVGRVALEWELRQAGGGESYGSNVGFLELQSLPPAKNLFQQEHTS